AFSKNGRKFSCLCIVGIGPEMSAGGKTLHENFNELSHIADYAIVLYPTKTITRHNVPYELGVFTQRFMTRDSTGKRISSRAVLVAAENKKVVKEFSDWSGVTHIKRPDAPTKKSGSTLTSDEVATGIFNNLKERIPLFR